MSVEVEALDTRDAEYGPNELAHAIECFGRWTESDYQKAGRTMGLPDIPLEDGHCPSEQDASLRSAIWYRSAALRKMDEAQRNGVALHSMIANFLHVISAREAA